MLPISKNSVKTQLIVSRKLLEILKKQFWGVIFDFTRNIIIDILRVLDFEVLQKNATNPKLNTC